MPNRAAPRGGDQLRAHRELQPDLILAVYSGLTQDQYDLLAQIAPPWPSRATTTTTRPVEDMTRGIAGVGREDEAEEAIGRSSRSSPTAATSTPVRRQLGGLRRYLEPGHYYAETEGSTRAAILIELGFTMPDIPADGFFAEVSREQVELFDHDVVSGARRHRDGRHIRADPVYEQLAVAPRGATSSSPTPTWPWAGAHLGAQPPVRDRQARPQLAAAVDGDPATAVPA